MKLVISLSLLLAVAGTATADDLPKLPYDPNTTPYCSWWWDNTDNSVSCQYLPDIFGLTVVEFRRWNPSLDETCASYATGRSYCVEAYGEPGPTSAVTSTAKPTSTSSSSLSKSTITSTSESSSSTKTSSSTTSTSTGNGITTPTPIQPGMVGNCDLFYFVKNGDTCAVIATKNGITVDQLVKWNPEIGGTPCSSLWANAYVCVSIIGHTSTPSTTSTGNGIATPTPTQPGIVGNCDAFYLVKTGDTCATIATKYGITASQFAQWNPQAGGTACNGLWANAYACVSIVGHTPTTTSAGNGIATPTPIQPSIVTNCDLFYLVKTGDTCAIIASKNGITVAQFQTWNPKANSDCSGLWANTYACISIVGHTPTKPGNGVTTPTPFQTGMTTSCKTFHKVVTGDTCAIITAKYKITVADFVKWNPGAKSDCTGLWKDNYACVAVL